MLTATITEQNALRKSVCEMLERFSSRHPSVFRWGPTKDMVDLGGGNWLNDMLIY